MPFKKNAFVSHRRRVHSFSQSDIKLGRVYPSLSAIRDISKAIAKEIVKEKGRDVRDVDKAVWSP